MLRLVDFILDGVSSDSGSDFISAIIFLVYDVCDVCSGHWLELVC